MARNQASSRQIVIGVALAVAGSGALFAALLHNKMALTMTPGVEGSLIAAVVGVALALSEGVAYTTVVMTAIPIFIMQYLACRSVGEPSLALLGLQGVIVGLVGLIAPARSAARSRSAPRSQGGLLSRAMRADAVAGHRG